MVRRAAVRRRRRFAGICIIRRTAVKLYTRTGDSGQTSLFDNRRVSKADPRVDAYGEVDELNAWLGHVRALRVDSDLDAIIHQLQCDLFAMGAQLADPAGRLAARV